MPDSCHPTDAPLRYGIAVQTELTLTRRATVLPKVSLHRALFYRPREQLNLTDLLGVRDKCRSRTRRGSTC